MMPLAGYATTEAVSLGRKYEEAPVHDYRTEYQRDRDRILHSAAFQRLGHKTQVFLAHEGDLFRTRLCHVSEVAQVSRLVARNLRLNDDLAEAIALGQDLGHTPFGHVGQESLNHCLKQQGGFEHSLQSLRIVDELEDKYPQFRGLNLMFETREGILKQCTAKQAKTLGQLGARFLNEGQITPPNLEAQIAHLCDEIVYNKYDIEDSLRAKLISIRQLRDQPLFGEHYGAVIKQWPQTSQRRIIDETIRRLRDELITNMIETSRDQLEAVQPDSVKAVRTLGEPLITFSALLYEKHLELKQFLYTQVYQHYRVRRLAFKAQQIIRRLFEAFVHDPYLLPLEAQIEVQRLQNSLGSEVGRIRAITDYVASLTDHHAFIEYERLFNLTDLSP